MQSEIQGGKYRNISERCLHFPTINTVSIFPCCEKAYNCYKCHNEKETHLMSPADKGYCIVCKKFFERKGVSCSNCLIKF